MRKNALYKDTFREIKNSFGRFLSILLIIACGVGFFVGVKATAPSMYKSGEQYFNKNALYDIQLMSTIGFDEDDVKAVKKIDEVEQAVGGYSVDVLTALNNQELVVKVLSLPGKDENAINVPELIEGRMPERDDECLISKDFDLTIGDTIEFKEKTGTTELNTVLKSRKYKIVGIASEPQYISYTYGTSSIGNGEVSAVALIPSNSFLYPRYTEMFLTFKCHTDGVSAFDSDYKDIIDAIKKQLESLGITQLKSFLSLSEAEIAKAEKEIADGQKELNDAKQKLDDAANQIASGEQEINDGWNQYYIGEAEAKVKIAEAQEQITQGQEQLSASKQLYDSIKPVFDAALATYNVFYNQYSTAYSQAQAAYQAAYDADPTSEETQQRYNEMMQAKANLDSLAKDKATLDEYSAQMNAATEQINAAQAQIDAGKQQLAESKIATENELINAQNQLYSAEDELERGREEYYLGLAEYNEKAQSAEQELSSGMNRIQNAKSQLGEIKTGKWYIFSRNDIMTNYSGFQSDADRVSAIADVFPVFFLLVAALVCVTTMSRMIDEQRMQLGTYKALGYKQSEIMSKYIIYAALACLGGCLIGPLICVQVLPRVIFSAYSELYRLPHFSIDVPWLMYLLSVIVALLCTVLVAFLSCWKELRTTTAALMRPKAPKVGKKIFLEKIPFLWNRFSFFKKLTARNILRYKGRFIMTVIGIVGCMSLVVAGFGLDNAISPIVKLQYGEINNYNLDVYLNNAYSIDELKSTTDQLSQDKRLKQFGYFSSVDTIAYDTSEQESMDYTSFVVPNDPATFSNYITLRNPYSKSNVALKDDGAVITKKLAEKLDVKEGDSILMEVNEKKYTVRVSGIAESYINNYIYLTPAYYQKVTGKAPKYNKIFVMTGDQEIDQDQFTGEWLSKNDKIITMLFTETLEDRMSDTISSLKLVVFVMILCAGILAFIVLYNLTNINISERIREIATIKVLGFNRKEVNTYVFRENIIMSIFGIIIGCFGGYALAQFIISTVEVNMVTFSRDIQWTSYLFSALLTIIFTLLVNRFMSKRIKQISMVESLKAIE